MSLTAGNSMADADTSTAGGDETAFRALYKELVEIDTTRSAGSCTRAAEAMRARLRAAGFATARLLPTATPLQTQLIQANV